MQQHHVDHSRPEAPGMEGEDSPQVVSTPAPPVIEPTPPPPESAAAPQPPKAPEPRQWWRSRWFWIPATVIALYGLVGFFVAPRVIRAQLLKQLPPLLHRSVEVREVLFNPFAVSLTVRGFRVAGHDGSTLVGFEELYLNVAVLREIFGGVRLSEIRLVQPEVGLAIEKDGRLSIADLLEGGQKAPPPKEEKPLVIEVGHFVLDRGSLSFADYNRPQPFKARLEPLSIVLDRFTTEPQKNGVYDFKARLEPSTELAWKGDFSVTPLRSSGLITITGLQLAAFGPYLSGSTQLRVTEGVIDLSLPYRFDASQAPTQVLLTDGTIKLRRLRVQPPGREEALVTLGALSLSGVSVDLAAQKARVGTIALEDGRVLARRLADGKIELAELAGQKNPPKPEPAAAPASPKWAVEMGELRTSGLSLQWEDLVPKPPARLAVVDELSLRVGPYAFPGDVETRVQANMNLLGQGVFSLQGTARANAGFADLDLDLKDLPLAAFQPYVGQAITGAIAAGALQIKGHANVEPGPKPRSGAPAASRTRFTGALSLDNFSLVDQEANELAGFEKLELTKIATDSATLVTRMDKVLLKGARAHYRVKPDETSNWSTLSRAAPAAGEKPAPQPAAQPAKKPSGPQPQTFIRTVAIENLSVDMADRSVKPQYTLRLLKFGGAIGPLTLPGLSKARVDLGGRLDGSRLVVAGTLRPQGKDSDVDLAVSLAPWNLPPTTPYSIKYIAYPVEKGKLSFDVKYKLASRKIQGSILLVVNQLALGDSVESPTATKLPVKLALAILTDRSGKLEIDLPVEGDLDSPDYKFGGLIVKALVNVLEKAATAPFALLGSLFGTTEDMSFVEFAPGSSDLTAAERDKVGKLANALTERPALRLSIDGLFDPESDRQGLAKEELDDLLVAHRRDATPAGKTPPPDDQPLSESDRSSGLRALYQDRVVAVKERQAAQFEAQRRPVPPELLPKHNPNAAEMEAAVLASIEVTGDDLAELARSRAETVQEELVTGHQLPPDRVFLSTARPEAKPKRQAELQLE